MLSRLGLEQEDLFAIPLCVTWAAGMVRLAAQAWSAMQAAQPVAVELALRGSQSPWVTALRMPVVALRKWFGW